jgi:hypothetical protein
MLEELARYLERPQRTAAAEGARTKETRDESDAAMLEYRLRRLGFDVRLGQISPLREPRARSQAQGRDGLGTGQVIRRFSGDVIAVGGRPPCVG